MTTTKMFNREFTIITPQKAMRYAVERQYAVSIWRKSFDEFTDFELWAILKICNKNAKGMRNIPSGIHAFWYSNIAADFDENQRQEIMSQIVEYAETKYTKEELDQRLRDNYYNSKISNDELCKMCLIVSPNLFRDRLVELGLPTDRHRAVMIPAKNAAVDKVAELYKENKEEQGRNISRYIAKRTKSTIKEVEATICKLALAGRL